MGINRPTRDAVEYIFLGFLLSQTAVLSTELRRGVVLRLLVVVAAILRGTAPNRLLVFVGTNDSVQVIVVIRCRPLGVLSEPPLFLQVPQQDVSLLGVSRIAGRVGSVRVMSGGPILRGVSEQLFSESDKALPPTLRVIQAPCHSELLRLVGSLLSGSAPPTKHENQEDESASESHEKNLPPLESV